MSKLYDWIGFYKEFATKLLNYKNDRAELISIIRRAYDVTEISLPTLDKGNDITIHSHNLYQIFTYVKNLEAVNKNESRISGILLYAKTSEQIQPNNIFHMSGNEIAVRTLDLNQDFSEIRKTLDDIADHYFINCRK